MFCYLYFCRFLRLVGESVSVGLRRHYTHPVSFECLLTQLLRCLPLKIVEKVVETSEYVKFLTRAFWFVSAGGPAEKCGQLKVKDEIISVNGVDFTNMRHYEAWNHLKFLDDGEIRLRIRREQS